MYVVHVERKAGKKAADKLYAVICSWPTNTSTKEIFLIIFSNNSEACASELLVKFFFPLYYICGAILCKFIVQVHNIMFACHKNVKHYVYMSVCVCMCICTGVWACVYEVRFVKKALKSGYWK